MKVKIGPYITWWGPYQILELLTYLGFSKDTTHHWAENSPEWFTNLCQWVHDKRKRKIKVKIHGYDVWSMDTTLAYIIIPMLEKLKANKNGTPMSMFKDEDGVDENGSATEEASGKAIARWDMTMDHMIWSFKQLIDDDYESFQIVAGELDFSKYPEDEGKTCYPLRWKVEPETRWDAYMAYEEKIQEGLELFGKHYRSLWD